ncbi:MAG: anti-sigma regulatory factor [Planctomycetes bacterium]|nr:anti-sigma regulatory factor [Planctomycetota bacterium]
MRYSTRGRIEGRDVTVAEELLRKSYPIHGRDFDKAGETATEIKGVLKEIGIDASLVHRTVVIAFEAEMNVVMYATEGTLTLVLTDEDVRLEIADRGPGIEDLTLALTEGFSTATDQMREMGFGFGMGLPNIRKNSDDFNIKSQVGVGTTVSALIRLNSSA